MYQYLARQRVHDRLVAEGKLAPVQEVNENSLSS